MVTSLLCIGVIAGSVLHVPSDYTTIQAAIDASTASDTVLVASGVYNDNIDFLGKAITVISEEGAASTTIDGSFPSDPDSGSVVFFVSGEGLSSVLRGFTIIGGTGTKDGDNRKGGGILIDGSSPTVSMNIIIGNSVSSVQNAYGGGVLCTQSSDPLISGNTIAGNSSSSSEGIGYGGGICYNYGSSPEIAFNLIRDNTSELGGGIYGKHVSQALICNNVICLNTTDYGGGVASNPGADATIVNNVIFGNEASFEGGGIYLKMSSPSLMNSIVWGNSAPQGSQIWIGQSGAPGQLTVDYSDVLFGPDSIWVGPGSSLLWGSGNIELDPIFESGILSDYHLAPGSPCIDTGNPDPSYNDPEDSGNPGMAHWPSLGTVRNDMGAYGGGGASYWTGIETETEIPAAEIGISVHPNPVSSVFNLTLTTANGGSVSISLFDTAGRIVHQPSLFQLGPGSSTIELRPQGLPSGLYIVNARTGDIGVSVPFILIGR